ncbi:MAG: O-antigen polymerase [bacterium]
MKNRKLFFYIFIIYLILTLLFWVQDKQAGILFAILSPVSGLFLFIAIREKGITISIFTLFFFLAHGIEPAFFFLDKENYTYYGWGAVKNFNFEVLEFLNIYILVYILMASILIFFIGLRKILFPLDKSLSSCNITKIDDILNINNNIQKKILFQILLIIFISLVIPISIAMFNNQIGILGLPQHRLPFKLTGALYFFRSLLVPVIIFYLYGKSNRSTLLNLIVLICALIAGLSGVSRSTLIFITLPTLFYAFKDRQYIRLVIIFIFISIGYEVITSSRLIVYYSYSGINFFDLIFSPELLRNITWDIPLKIFNNICGRLCGAQNVVLAYQYVIDGRISAIIKYFSLQRVIKDEALEFYGFILPPNMAIGVGIGFIPMLILLANKNIFVLILLGLITAFLLFLAEWMVRKLLSFKNNLSFLAYPLSFLIVYTLISSLSSIFYSFLLISIMINIFQHVRRPS